MPQWRRPVLDTGARPTPGRRYENAQTTSNEMTVTEQTQPLEGVIRYSHSPPRKKAARGPTIASGLPFDTLAPYKPSGYAKRAKVTFLLTGVKGFRDEDPINLFGPLSAADRVCD